MFNFIQVRFSTYKLIIVPVLLTNARGKCKQRDSQNGYKLIGGQHWMLLCAATTELTVGILNSLTSIRRYALESDRFINLFK